MKKLLAFITASVMLLSVCAYAQYSGDDLANKLNAAVEWKEKNAQPKDDVASEASDLYIISLKRMGMNYTYRQYSDLMQSVMKAYNSNVSASAYAHSIMALEACGIDPKDFNDRDYIAEGIYEKGNITGVDNWSMALTALDSSAYEVPDWAYDDRENMVQYILANQYDNGSFGDNAASTALAVIALEPYTYSDKIYTFVSDITGADKSLIVMQAVDDALNYLSNAQGDWGDYYDLKSTALVLMALDSMDIDAENDERFLRDNQSVVDGMMAYSEIDGGFSMHNDGSDSLATSYAICALTSHLRQIQGKGKMFDFLSDDKPSGIKQISLNTNTNKNNNTSNNTNSNNNSNNSSSNNSNNSGSSSNNSSSSSSSNNSGSSGSSNSSNSSNTSKATKAPSAAKATTRPKTTMKPAGTAHPRVASTMRPASSSSPKATVTPRATSAPRRKALVGPVEMPGPMPKTPEPEITADENVKSGGIGIAHSLPIGIAFLALAALITAGGITYIIMTNEKTKTTKKKRHEERYEAKIHRRTEIHGAYKARERYKERGKYKGSYRK